MDQDRSPLRRRRLATLALAAVPAAFLAYFFIYPLGSILLTGLKGDGGFGAGPFRDLIARGTLRGVIWFTLWQAVASTLLTLAAALPAAFVVARFDFPGKRLFRAFATIPFVLPPWWSVRHSSPCSVRAARWDWISIGPFGRS